MSYVRSETVFRYRKIDMALDMISTHIIIVIVVVVVVVVVRRSSSKIVLLVG